MRRVTPVGAPIALRVPLLPGEAPTRANLVVEKGEVAVSLGGDETETAWQSTLEQAPQLVLRAPEGRPWSEVWRLQCSPIWSCAATRPAARLAHRRGRLRSRVPALAGRDDHASASPTRRASRARRSRSTT